MGASRLLVTFNQNIILCIKKEDLVLDILLCQDIKHSLYGLQMFSASRIDTNRDPFYLCMKIGCKIYQLIQQRNGKIIDTSRLLTRELKSELERIFIHDEEFKSLFVTVLSFGFKYGIPADADIVMDVRFLPNPYYVEGLRAKTGNDVEIQQYVMQFEETKIFLDKLEDLIKFLIPNYISEGKNQLVIAIGCTGGKHRSVTLANELYKRLDGNSEYGLKIEHRDIGKDALRGK